MLSVKKKKRLKLVWFLGVLLLLWFWHGGISDLLEMDIRNEGVSFGWSGLGVVWLNLGLLVGLTWFGWKRNYTGVNLILLGGWVNMIDRLLFGYVRDYWQLGSVYNNIADWIISIGVGIFIWELWKKR